MRRSWRGSCQGWGLIGWAIIKTLAVITGALISRYIDESDENSAQVVDPLKAFQDIREKFKVKKARFPKILQALGELAVESTQLEMELRIVLCQLLTARHPEMNPDVVNAIAQERRKFEALADLVKKLFNVHIKDEKKRKPFHNAIGEAKSLMTERGHRIHGSWSLDYTTDKVAYFAHKAGGESVDPEDIEAIVKKIRACRDRIYETLLKAFRS
jgi:hypothetical protein